jgi:hypothetical protein
MIIFHFDRVQHERRLYRRLWLPQTSMLLISWGDALLSSIAVLASLGRAGGGFLSAVQFEILVLRHQISVLLRSLKRPKQAIKRPSAWEAIG